MATSTKEPGPLSKADRKHGFRIGVDGWATVAESAVILACSERTIERRIESGELRAIKLKPTPKGAVRICRRSIAEFIASREVCKTA
jgi:excisionase family DNA binding protein